MYCGPLGALGFVNGLVASQALKATSYSGRKRLSSDELVALAAREVGGEPGVEVRRVLGAQRQRSLERAIGLRANRRPLGQLERRLGVPLGRRVPGPGSGDGDDREQNGLDDREQPVVAMTFFSVVVRVLADLLADLGRGEPLGHLRILRVGSDITVVPKGSGAPGMIRTCDLCLRRAALYPLSYGRSGLQCSRAGQPFFPPKGAAWPTFRTRLSSSATVIWPSGRRSSGSAGPSWAFSSHS